MKSLMPHRGLSMLKPLLVAISFLLVSFVAKADVYFWRDAQGVLNYSDTPPMEGARNAGIFDVRALRRATGSTSGGTTTAGGASASSGTTTGASKPDFSEDFVGVSFPGRDN